MARKNGLKNDTNCSLTFNTRTKAVMSDVVYDVNIKEKVNSVREVVSGKGTSEIIMVLQFYDYDIVKTIHAYLEDGAKQALMEWKYSGNKLVNKKKRNKKKGNQSQQPPADIPQSLSSISTESESATAILTNGDVTMNGSLDYVTNLDATKTTKFIQNGPTTTSTYMLTNTNSMRNSPSNYSTHAVLTSTVPSILETDISKSTSKVQSSVNVTQSQLKKTDNSFSGQKSQVLEQPEVKTTSIRKEKMPSPQPQRQTHARQRMHSGPHHEESAKDYMGPHFEESGTGRVRTISTSSVDSKSGKKAAHGGLERSSKDLHRQTVSLERLRLIFDEEVDKANKRIKLIFDEIKSCVNAREVQLLAEIEQVQNIGRETFNMRQSLAAELKMKIDRAERMNEAELADLRNEIKHFVSDRKIDEDLARNTRFLYDNDKMKLEVAAFGEVVPVKCTYMPRRQTVSLSESSSHALSEHSHQEHLPLQTSIDIAKSSTHDKDSKPSLRHLDLSDKDSKPSLPLLDLSDKDIKPSLPHLDPSDKDIKPSLPHLDPSDKDIKPSLPHLDPSDKDTKPSLPHLDPSDKDTKPSLPHLDPSDKDTKPSLPHLDPSDKDTKPSLPHLDPSDKDTKPSLPHLDPSDRDTKPSLSHLDPSEMQRRLKPSVVLKSIPVETYPERPESAPVVQSASRSFSNSSRSATARRNQNRPRPNDRGNRGQGSGDLGLKDDIRVKFNQTSSGERVIVIGRKTGSQGSRPPRGEGGRGGYRGRGRGGSTPNVPRGENSEDTKRSNSLGDKGSGTNAKSDSQVSNSQGENASIGALPQREGSGSSRRSGGPRSSNKGYSVTYHNRDGNHSNPAGSGNYGNNLNQAKPIEHEQGATGGN